MVSQHHTTGRPCWSGGPSLDAEVRADGAMPPQILGDGRALAPPARHHYRLTPVTKASVSGRLKDVLSLLLFHCRQLNPLHLFSPPLLRILTKGYLKKDAKSSGACISGVACPFGHATAPERQQIAG
jgi:hypothetical protein